MILISNDFWHDIKMYNFDPYNVLLVIATNIAVLLMTGSVLQGHICDRNMQFVEIKPLRLFNKPTEHFVSCLLQPLKLSKSFSNTVLGARFNKTVPYTTAQCPL